MVVSRRQREFGQAARQTVMRLVPDPAVQVVAFRHREVGQVIGAERQLEVAALGQFHAVGQGLGQVGEQRRHLLRRLQVLLGVVGLGPLRVVQHPAGGDAGAGLVRLEIGGIEEAHVVAGQQRQMMAVGEGDRARVEAGFLRQAEPGDLDVRPAREQAQPFRGPACRLRLVALQHQLRQRAVPAVQHDQAFALGEQPFRLDHRQFAGVAFQVRARDQPRQAEVAGLVLAQHGDPVEAALAVVHEQVGAGDRLDAGAFGGLEELDQGEQVAVVGHRHRRHAQRRAARHQFGQADGGIRQREFAVQMAVDEGRGHGRAWNGP